MGVDCIAQCLMQGRHSGEVSSSWHSFHDLIQLLFRLFNPMNCSTPGFPHLDWGNFNWSCSPSTGAWSNSCPLSRGCHPSISSSVAPFSSYPQSSPASQSFPMIQLLASGGQSIGTSASASVLPMNIQGWFPLGFSGLNSLQSKGLSRVFSNTTVQKHQFFGTQPFFLVQLSQLYMTTRKTIALTRRTSVSNVSAFYYAV